MPTAQSLEKSDLSVTFVIHHDMGKNTAYYIKNYFRRSLEIMKAKDIEVKSTNDTLWVEFTI